MRERKGLAGLLFDTGTRLVTRAAETVMQDARGQEAIARAIGAAQRGRKRLEDLQSRAMKLAGIPARQDYQDINKQLARIKRKARELDERLRQSEPAEAEAEAGATSGGGDEGPGPEGPH